MANVDFMNSVNLDATLVIISNQVYPPAVLYMRYTYRRYIFRSGMTKTNQLIYCR